MRKVLYQTVERDFIFFENDSFCDANIAGPLKETRPLANFCRKVNILLASRSCLAPLPRKSMLSDVAWTPAAMLPRPRPGCSTLISGGGGGKQNRDAAKMLTLQHNFARRRISLSGYATFASQKCSFSIKIKSRSSRL